MFHISVSDVISSLLKEPWIRSLSIEYSPCLSGVHISPKWSYQSPIIAERESVRSIRWNFQKEGDYTIGVDLNKKFNFKALISSLWEFADNSSLFPLNQWKQKKSHRTYNRSHIPSLSSPPLPSSTSWPGYKDENTTKYVANQTPSDPLFPVIFSQLIQCRLFNNWFMLQNAYIEL